MNTRDSEFSFIISDLRCGKFRSDQIEKKGEKWIKRLLKSTYEKRGKQTEIVLLLQLVLGTFQIDINVLR